MKLYHFYFDEGGMIGDAWILIKERKQQPHRNHYNKEITNYYCGQMTMPAIDRMITLFKHKFPNCPIYYELGSLKTDVVPKIYIDEDDPNDIMYGTFIKKLHKNHPVRRKYDKKFKQAKLPPAGDPKYSVFDTLLNKH